MILSEMSRDELLSFRDEALARYNDFKAQGLSLNMSRGNPCKEQLELSVSMLAYLLGHRIVPSIHHQAAAGSAKSLPSQWRS